MPDEITGDCLSQWDLLIARLQGLKDKLVGVDAEHVDSMLKIYKSRNKMGTTALGPAVLASVELASAVSLQSNSDHPSSFHPLSLSLIEPRKLNHSLHGRYGERWTWIDQREH